MGMYLNWQLTYIVCSTGSNNLDSLKSTGCSNNKYDTYDILPMTFLFFCYTSLKNILSTLVGMEDR